MLIRYLVRYNCVMAKTERKITVMISDKLIEKATKASGENLTATIRRGLELVSAKTVYQNALSLKGKVDLKLNLEDSRKEKDE